MTTTTTSSNFQQLSLHICSFQQKFKVLRRQRFRTWLVYRGLKLTSQCSDTVHWATWRVSRLKSWVMVCWWSRIDWSFARLIAPAVTITSIIIRSNKIQNGDILVLANRSTWKMDAKTETQTIFLDVMHGFNHFEKCVQPQSYCKHCRAATEMNQQVCSATERGSIK